MSTDWIPGADAAFDAFYENYCRIVGLRTGGPSPEWTHIPPVRVTELNDGRAVWFAAYDKLRGAHTSGDVLAKNEAGAAGRRVLRGFNNEFILYSSLVSDQDRVDLGNRLRNPPSPISSPVTRPEFTIRLLDLRRLGLFFWNQGSASRAKPYGMNGAVVYWAVLGRPPAGIEELTNTALATRSPYILEFTDQQRGKMVYIAMRWQNKTGKEGPASEIQNSIIP
jgi:hypothetical protein